jgi:hypothetical protein
MGCKKEPQMNADKNKYNSNFNSQHQENNKGQLRYFLYFELEIFLEFGVGIGVLMIKYGCGNPRT